MAAPPPPAGAPAGGGPAARSEKEKMLAGELYYAFDDTLLSERQAAKALIHTYNTTLATRIEGRTELLKQLLGGLDEADPPFIEPPFYCDYGYNIHIGAGSYMNFGATILDGCRVTIGARVLFGPNVQVYAATHPIEGHVRQGIRGPEYSKPITIGDDVWVGGAVVICPGVTIGAHAVVGAGSVVTRDVKPWTVVAGNPARLIRRIERPDGNDGDAAAVVLN
ncbi:maa [Scenedesmus sp. PABB004]|nr:maa [Scenedesmus sp. PABB004]